VCSDLSAIHGIRDATRLDSAVFFTLAVRLPAYRGAVAASIAAAAAEAAQDGQPPAPTVAAPVPAAAPARDQDIRARFAAAGRMPVATAGQLAAMSARASAPGQPAGSVAQVPPSQ